MDVALDCAFMDPNLAPESSTLHYPCAKGFPGKKPFSSKWNLLYC